MSFSNIKFTTKGRNLHAKVQAGATLNFTKLAIGDGDNGGASSDAYDNLLNTILNITITKIKATSDGSAIVGGIFNNSGLAAFYFREIALFATDPDLGEILYCYGNAGATAEYIPAGEGSTILERQLNIVAVIGNATSLSANIDYSMYATMEFVQNGVANHNISGVAHADIREQINNLAPHLSDLITDADGAHGLKVESGIWTPVLKAGTGVFTHSVQEGKYTKIKNVVTITCRLKVSAKPAETGGLSISGLPFSALTYASGSIGAVNGVANADIKNLSLEVSGVAINLYRANANFVAVIPTDINATFEIWDLTVSYLSNI